MKLLSKINISGVDLELSIESNILYGTINGEKKALMGIPGKSAYESYLETTLDNPKLTEKEWSDFHNKIADILKSI